MNILKIFTYTGCSQDYWDHIMHYPSNEDSVAVRGYGVDDSNPQNAERQFKDVAKYYGNERKNPFNQYMISLTRETAPDSETAMAINEEFLKPLKDEHLILAGQHKKHTESSDYHFHNYVSTTNLRNGKMLHAKNENNFPMAQRLANITQQEVLLVIEKRKPNSLEIDHSRKPYEKVFKPQKNKK